jgi:methyltransferase (TIGR00027 family)
LVDDHFESNGVRASVIETKRYVMKPGQGSRTAELVCMGRAMAHGDGFSDPTARVLLGDAGRARLDNAKGWFLAYLKRQSGLMVVRTVAIDEAVRTASTPQVVILGAGLDGRAWRMNELGGAVVFEVDHPDTQRDKRERASGLAPAARDVRFVPVDFERDKLGAALEAAGHDPTKPTTWIWEGVVMYLAIEDIETTLAVIQQRSAAGSTLIVVYHQPSPVLWFANIVLKRLGEPLKSRFRRDEMEALLARYGYSVSWDKNIPELAENVSEASAEAMKRMSHLRIAAATSSS